MLRSRAQRVADPKIRVLERFVGVSRPVDAAISETRLVDQVGREYVRIADRQHPVEELDVPAAGARQLERVATDKTPNTLELRCVRPEEFPGQVVLLRDLLVDVGVELIFAE